MDKKHNLVWIDLEMTGLNPTKDVILEIASTITDSELRIIAQGPELVIHQPEEKLNEMIPEVRTLHEKSGLLAAVAISTTTLDYACQTTLQFIKQYCEPKTALLSGNSVWQDRNFLVAYMPEIPHYLHYRIIDISGIKELVRRWYPTNPAINFKKNDNHRAAGDVLASIEELRHYRNHFFVQNPK